MSNGRNPCYVERSQQECPPSAILQGFLKLAEQRQTDAYKYARLIDVGEYANYMEVLVKGLMVFAVALLCCIVGYRFGHESLALSCGLLALLELFASFVLAWLFGVRQRATEEFSKALERSLSQANDFSMTVLEKRVWNPCGAYPVYRCEWSSRKTTINGLFFDPLLIEKLESGTLHRGLLVWSPTLGIEVLKQQEASS